MDEALAARVRDEIFAPLGNEETLSYKELEEAARNVMNYYMGFRRSMTGMARALEKIRFLSDQASRLHADTLRDLMRCHEAKDVLTICELAIQATMRMARSISGARPRFCKVHGAPSPAGEADARMSSNAP